MKDPSSQAARTARPRKSESRDFVEFLLKLAVFVFILRSLIVSTFSIPSESMLPRLMIGDYLFVQKWPYGFSRASFPFGIVPIEGRVLGHLPARGDVAVFKAPPGNDVDYIKRVIGLPGDTVQMRDGHLILNGTPVPKRRIADFVAPVTPNSPCFAPQFTEAGADGTTACRYPRYRETLPEGKSYDVLDIGSTQADDTQVYVVPQGRLFMMGDDRDRSADSRFDAVEGGGIGMVPVDNLVGRAWLSVFSTDGSAHWLLPWTWFGAARWQRIGDTF